MLICIECGCLFEPDEIKYWEEKHGLEHGPFEQHSGCPNCLGAYTDAVKCSCCDEWIEDEEYVETDDGCKYCSNCYTIIKIGG